jgi:hypothetical protein
VSDERDNPGNHGDIARRGGAGIYIPDGGTTTDADADHAEPHNNNGMTGGASGQKEIGGRDGPDPTRFGDWEIKGRCIDF